jgi:hypothetical protein
MPSIQQDGTDSASGAEVIRFLAASSDVSLIGVIHRVKRSFGFREIVSA